MDLIGDSPETYRHIRGLRVVRGFADVPITKTDLKAILEAARWTGSSKNVQGWEFIVVDGEQLAALAEAGKFTDPLRNSAATIALVESPEGNTFDIGRAAQNIMLAAAALGIGSCPITLHHDEVAKRVLGLPLGYACRYAVALGHPDEEGEERLRLARRAGGLGGRKPLQTITHHQTFQG